jgi:Holliday junction resolvase RusA-like endonuclease
MKMGRGPSKLKNKETWYQFFIQMTPMVKKNSRPIFKNKKTGKHFLGKDQKLINYESDAVLCLKSQRGISGLREPLAGILEAKLFFVFSDDCRCDVDNLATMAFDVTAKAGIITNDKMVKRFTATVLDNTKGPSHTKMFYREIPREEWRQHVELITPRLLLV